MMKKTNPHIGSSFESWLDEEGIREEVTAAAVKQVIAEQLAAEMKRKGITKAAMAEMMNTSRAQVDRLLDPKNKSATLETLMRAVKAVTSWANPPVSVRNSGWLRAWALLALSSASTPRVRLPYLASSSTKRGSTLEMLRALGLPP